MAPLGETGDRDAAEDEVEAVLVAADANDRACVHQLVEEAAADDATAVRLDELPHA